jgi:hypothetical protein
VPPPGNGTTSLFLTAQGLGTKTATIPYDIGQLDAQQATKVIELAVGLAMGYFQESYLRLRFEPYARVKLGYRITPSHERAKRRESRVNADAKNPNVWTGDTKRMVLTSSYVETQATGGKGTRSSKSATARLRIRTPGYINQQKGQITNSVLSKMTAEEFSRVADKFFKIVADMMATVTTRFDPNYTGRGRTQPIRPLVGEQFRRQFGVSSRSTILAQRRSAAGESRAS